MGTARRALARFALSFRFAARPSPFDAQPVGLAVFAAMAAPVLKSEALLLRLGTEAIGNLAAVLEDDVATLGHAERLFQQPEMIVLGVARMLERLEPCRVHEIRHLKPVNHAGVFL